jgi:Zn finger protein HypA/HybF involved in hydrogenase expression
MSKCISLEVGNISEVSEELYEMLLDAFLAKALAEGYDVVRSPHLMLDHWRISCEVVDF